MSEVDRGLAFLFPGQGSQSVGMLSALAGAYKVVGDTFGEASEVLGYDLWRLVNEGPEERLNETWYTQPAMLAADVSVWRVFQQVYEVRPAYMAGHSLGEYSALVCARSLSFQDGIRLVQERARFMQEAVPSGVGAMAAIIGLEDAGVVAACDKASSTSEKVTAANFNAPGQVVIAGHSAAVTRAGDLAKAAGAKRCVLLPVSVPSHCPLMAEAALKFRDELEKISFEVPECSILHNVDVCVHAEGSKIRAALEAQLSGPVRWTETILKMAESGVDRFFECGPGAVLAGLNKRIVPAARTQGLSDPAMIDTARELCA